MITVQGGLYDWSFSCRFVTSRYNRNSRRCLTATSDCLVRFDVITSTFQSQIIRYDVLVSSESSKQIDWDVLSSTQSDSTVRWNSITSVQSDSNTRMECIINYFN